jgi:DtxR family Mn-dependent transcriptional regulator
MPELSTAEENYLKAIAKVAEQIDGPATTNAVAEELGTSAASVTDMFNRLSDKELVNYKSRRGASLTDLGERLVLQLIRRHRLWETFLHDKLDFAWDEIHELAEQLEHIKSRKLIDRLDALLGHPRFDPHGDPIPRADGSYAAQHETILAELPEEGLGIVVGVKEHDSEFLRHLDRLGLGLGQRVRVLEHFPYDQSLRIEVAGTQRETITARVAEAIYVQVADA